MLPFALRFKNRVLAETVLRQRLFRIKDKAKMYLSSDKQAIECYQLQKFNHIWKHCYFSIPFYKMWRRKHHLPEAVRSIEEIKQFPILTKKDIQEHQETILLGYGSGRRISTGGSTGVPVAFPMNASQANEDYANVYLGRFWHGIAPLDSAVVFWGHAHLFGSGIKGKLAQKKRKFFDCLLNQRRFSGYETGSKILEDVYRKLIKIQPQFILGYTSYIYKMCLSVSPKLSKSKPLRNLKGVILTAEAVSLSEIKEIERFFNAPVIIEYGAAETGPLAYSKDSVTDLRVFWDSILMTLNKNKEVVVTTLQDREFPLIQYALGDKVLPLKMHNESVLSLSEVQGRVKDAVCLKGASGEKFEINPILVVHILKAKKNIRSIQIIRMPGNAVKIKFTASCLTNPYFLKQYFLEELKKNLVEIDSSVVVLEQVEALSRTISGKEQLVVDFASE